MAKKKKGSPKTKKTKAAKGLAQKDGKKLIPLLITILVIVGLAVTSPIWEADFINYDDQDYVTENLWVQGEGKLSDAFSGGMAGNYHPLTMISLRVQHGLWGLNPLGFHATNIFFHLMNGLLLFFFIYSLSGKMQWVAFGTSLLFLVHPMHLESVAWISEHKDVLYLFFSLIALGAYTVKEQFKTLSWAICILAFIAALLSKPAAAVLPLLFVLIEYYQLEKLKIKDLLKITPFAVGGILILFITYQLQEFAAVDREAGLISNLGNSGYAFLQYLILSIAPYKFSILHPYPENAHSFLYLLSFLLFFVAVLFAWKRKLKSVVFGMLFFFFGLLLVLQFVPVGRAVYAERYSYLPFIGLYFILATFLAKFKMKGLIPLFGFCAVLALSSFSQAKFWKDSKSIWTRHIELYPEDYYGYLARGNYYNEEGLLVEATLDYSRGIELNKSNERLFNARATCFATNREYGKALADLNTALNIKPDFEEAFVNRGKTYFETAELELAKKDFLEAQALGNNSFVLMGNLGSIYAQKGIADSARHFFEASLEQNPKFLDSWLNLANLNILEEKFSDVESNLNSYLESGGQRNTRYHFTKSIAAYELGRFESSLTSIDRAIKISGKFPELLQYRALNYLKLNRISEAREVSREAVKMAKELNQAFVLDPILAEIVN